jgi:hypothetical protein
MSSALKRLAYFAALAAATAGATAAFANQPIEVYHGPIEIGHGDPNAAACAAGFTAKPSTIQGSNPYDQSYTCTGPTIVCSAHFAPEASVAGTIPAAPGQLLGQPIYGSPVTMQGGRMVYTCVEPPSPPK